MAKRKGDETPDDTGRAILEAAIAVFTRDGFEAARVDEIAKRAGVAKGSVYNHFADKEELFFSVVAREIDEMNRMIAGVDRELASLPLDGFLRGFVAKVHGHMVERRGAGMTIFSDSWGRLRADLRRRIVERLRDHLRFVADVVADRAGLAGIALEDPETVVTTLLGVAFIFGHRRRLFAELGVPPSGDEEERRIRFMGDLLHAAVGGRPPG